MPGEIRKAVATTNAQLDTTAALLDDGYLRIYDGSRPATGDTALSGQTQLAELRFGNPAFGPASSGVITANLITQDTSADATGLATWYRTYRSDGTTPVFDGNVGTNDENLVMNNANIQANAIIQVSSFTYSQPNQP